jgi:dynein heavy chain
VGSGKIAANYLKGLLSKMNLNFIPNFVKDKSWPVNAKKDFLVQLHYFMASLTEIAFLQEGLTELYIPNEDLRDIKAAVADKDLI